MKGKILRTAAATVMTFLILIALAACAGTGQKADTATLTLGFGGELDNMYPTMTSYANFGATKLVYETLVNYDNGEIKPGLAASWSFNEAGTELTLQLREGVRFHDGEAFNAEAVKANLDYYRLEPNAAFIKGVSAISKVEAVGEHTVKIAYPAPYYAILPDLTTPHILAMVSPKTIIPGNYERMTDVVGTGPYRYDTFVKGEHTLFTRNEEYRGAAPAYERVIAKYIPDPASRLKALQTGEIDMIYGSSLLTADDYKQALTLKGVGGQVSESTVRTRSLVLNASGSLLNDLSVREAVAHAIDSRLIAESLTYGYERQAEQLFDKTVPYAHVELDKPRGYDPQAAEQLLEEAGWRKDADSGIREKNGTPLNLVFSYDESDAMNKDIALAIKSQLAEAGIGVETRGLDMMLWWTESMEGKFDITVWGTGGPPQDPHNFMSPMLDSTAHTAAVSGLADAAAFNQAIISLFTMGESEQVAETYDYLINYLNNQVIVVPLMYAKELVAYRTDAVESYAFGGLASIFDPTGVKSK